MKIDQLIQKIKDKNVFLQVLLISLISINVALFLSMLENRENYSRLYLVVMGLVYVGLSAFFAYLKRRLVKRFSDIKIGLAEVLCFVLVFLCLGLPYGYLLRKVSWFLIFGDDFF
ncbi:MAG: hypothetical protein CME65_08305 [Halobacteriovoraceae bacterium]|nr:hypothetical protein [Halobacteriovoraceae bacterium]